MIWSSSDQTNLASLSRSSIPRADPTTGAARRNPSVVVVMGESINAAQLSVVGFRPDSWKSTNEAWRLRVKRFARNGQFLGEEVRKLPEIAGANAVYAQEKSPADGPQTN